MRTTVARLLVALALCVPVAASSAVVHADGKDGAKPVTSPQRLGSGDCARARKANKVCQLVIEGEDVEGGVATGSGSQIDVALIVTHSSLIRLRTSFRDMIIRTGERL